LKRERGRRERIFLHLSWLFRCFVQCVLLLIELQGFYCSLIKPISLKLFFLFFRVLVAVSCLANFGIWVLGFELLTFSLLGFLSFRLLLLSLSFFLRNLVLKSILGFGQKKESLFMSLLVFAWDGELSYLFFSHKNLMFHKLDCWRWCGL